MKKFSTVLRFAVRMGTALGVAVLFAFLSSVSAFADANGRASRTATNSNGCGIGGGCHATASSSQTTVTITSGSGSFTVASGSTTTFTAVVAHSSKQAAGIGIAVKTDQTGSTNIGTLAPGSGSGLALKGTIGELTHTTAKAMSGGSASFAFSWTAPSTPGTYYLRAVGNAVNNDGSEDSGDIWNWMQPQAITVQAASGSVTVTSPNGGNTWCAGSTQSVTWTSSGLSLVKIDLSSDGGSTYPTTLVTNATASVGAWSWAIPAGQSLGTQYKIRISSSSDGTINDVGNANFSIIGSPTISSHPASQSVPSGSTVTFSVTASGSGLSYQWRKNGVNISGAASASYSISSAQSSDAGTYSVVVTNSCGSTTSNNATLTVSATALASPSLTSPSNGATGQNTSLTLSWGSVSGATSYTIQISTNAGFTSTILNQNQSGTTYSASSLANSTTYYWRVLASNSTTTSSWSSTFSFTTIAGGSAALMQAWAFASQTGNNATIGIPSSLVPTIAGRAMQTGDAIGVFFLRNDSLICAGYTMWQSGAKVITAWGDNGQTSWKDGFVSSELIRYKVWDGVANVQYPASVTYSQGSGNYSANGLYVLNGVTVYAYDTLAIPMHAGWNMISSNVKPADSTLVTMLSGGITNNLMMMKNNAGNVFWPAMNINTIGSWNYKEGYYTYMANPDTLRIIGKKLLPQNVEISLASGWNVVAYLRNSPMSADTAFDDLGEHLIIAKDNDGGVYWPTFGVNTIGTLKTGQGYQVYLDESQGFKYPANSSATHKDDDAHQSAKSGAERPTHFSFESLRTGNSAVVLIQNVAEGEEVGIFTTDNRLVGAGIAHNGNAVITVWGVNSMTPLMTDGAREGENLHVKTWSPEGERTARIGEIRNALRNAEPQNSLIYSANRVFMTRLQSAGNAPTELALTNAPNPFTNETLIRFDVPESGFIAVELFDVLGNKVASVASGNYSAGTYHSALNAEHLSSGVYFCRLSVGTSVVTKEISVIR